jgi:lysophospholipase L1-like esterase
MKRVADRRDVPMVDALELFLTHLDALRAGALYPEDVAYYERLYGADAMAANWRYYVTTDGCHPNRAGHGLIADALVPAVERALARRMPS